MKYVVVIGLFCIQAGVIVTENSNKVKLVNYKSDYLNKSYTDVKNTKLKVIKVNETYNRLYAKVKLLKDFPQDTKADVEVLRSRSCRGPWKKLGKYSSRICDENDKYRTLVPKIFIAQTQGGKCVQKGQYKFDDAGSFKFYELLPEKEWQSYYIKSVTILGNGDIKLAEVEMLHQSNELPP